MRNREEKEKEIVVKFLVLIAPFIQKYINTIAHNRSSPLDHFLFL
jgi:hypothetical protein